MIHVYMAMDELNDEVDKLDIYRHRLIIGH